MKNISKKISPKTHWREILAILMLLLAIVFFRNERRELRAIVPQLWQSDPFWLASAFCLTFLYLLFQAGIYKQSFSSIGLNLKWVNGVLLFLKRNFISIFLPAGGVSALAYSPSEIRRQGFSRTQVHQASALFSIAGFLTVFIAGFPIIVYTVITTSKFKDSWWGLLIVLIIIVSLFLALRSIRAKGKLYQSLDKRFPALSARLSEIVPANVNKQQFAGAVSYSLGVELSGMLYVYIAMLAIGVEPSFGIAAAAYIIAVLMMIISPFLRGLGAVELSMVYVLEQFGYSSAIALSITILYRIFEFWLPLILGLLSFVWVGRKIVYRVIPVLLTLLLGIVNIISVITPPVHNRLHLLRNYLPLNVIHASNLLVLLLGLALIITSAYLIRGLRNAWIVALAISTFSFIGHLTKDLEYEQAFLAFMVLIILIASASQYSLRSSKRYLRLGIKTALLAFSAVIIFGFVSFYFIDARHFHVDFSWKESLLHTLKIFLLVEDNTLAPATKFGKEFIVLIRSLGFLTWGFLLFTLIKTEGHTNMEGENQKEKAKFLLEQYGNSSVDYFKIYKDKLIFLSENYDAFIAYRISDGFAIVLEDPVCAEEYKVDVLREFNSHCRKMGLKPAFYRVDEDSLPWFNQLYKNKMMIGQEAILDTKNFTLSGGDKKSLRNGLNSLQKKGFTTTVYPAPHSVEFLQKLRKVSDEWLHEFDKNESVFSQGMFDENELKEQDIIAVSDEHEEIKAFLNIIPDYAEDDCTYDLIRKTKDAPGAAMDSLIIKMIDYTREKGKQFINLGLVPMTGIDQPDNTAEKIIKIATEKIKRFQHYKGLREFKEKYATIIWENKYLVYDNDFDLLQLPIAIKNVMKPGIFFT